MRGALCHQVRLRNRRCTSAEPPGSSHNAFRLLAELLASGLVLALLRGRSGVLCRAQAFNGGLGQITLAGLAAFLAAFGAPLLVAPVFEAALRGFHQLR